ncbi:hypothetical protein ACHAWF_002551 [Thalassiosira exigua]
MHYKAIELGTVPITELDPFLVRHLAPAPVVFNTTNWNLKALEAKLDPNPVVDQNLIIEGYWMEWCDDVVGGPSLAWKLEHDNSPSSRPRRSERGRLHTYHGSSATRPSLARKLEHGDSPPRLIYPKSWLLSSPSYPRQKYLHC